MIQEALNPKHTSAARTPKAAKRTILRRLLSHHELATLLLLLHAPIDAQAKPEIPMLQEAGLVEQVPNNTGSAGKIRLTSAGSAVLQGLGLAR
ncbi:hypothetical protein [Paraburkholderia dinghuensis]|uniref:ArsR family transcriptional regulator n=1 Tax=Paraburkholderia dinghuensis TaxID=2305225 RepID=A0A3N6MP65_9BURK|nr:hypothetical protein [Paraburkholderia dinghuensis]RQH05509.1 hypothetical protein D1Y85_15265 [Paraburkholderia dinghuensis]